jgi:hypothetical protein
LTKPDKTQPQKTKPLSGGVQHDARGNAVWQWATETARHALASTSQLLRRLDVSSLSLEDEQSRKTPSRGAPGKPAPTKPVSPVAPVKRPASAGKPRRGFNPYDGAAMPAAAAAKKKRPAASAPARSSWWRRLFQRR